MYALTQIELHQIQGGSAVGAVFAFGEGAGAGGAAGAMIGFQVGGVYGAIAGGVGGAVIGGVIGAADYITDTIQADGGNPF